MILFTRFEGSKNMIINKLKIGFSSEDGVSNRILLSIIKHVLKLITRFAIEQSRRFQFLFNNK